MSCFDISNIAQLFFVEFVDLCLEVSERLLRAGRVGDNIKGFVAQLRHSKIQKKHRTRYFVVFVKVKGGWPIGNSTRNIILILVAESFVKPLSMNSQTPLHEKTHVS